MRFNQVRSFAVSRTHKDGEVPPLCWEHLNHVSEGRRVIVSTLEISWET